VEGEGKERGGELKGRKGERRRGEGICRPMSNCFLLPCVSTKRGEVAITRIRVLMYFICLVETLESR